MPLADNPRLKKAISDLFAAIQNTKLCDKGAITIYIPSGWPERPIKMVTNYAKRVSVYVYHAEDVECVWQTTQDTDGVKRVDRPRSTYRGELDGEESNFES